MKFLLLIVSLGLTPNVEALELELRREAVTTTIIADWLQTREIAKSPEAFKEITIHKIIGIHPSKASVNWFFASKILLHYYINSNLRGTKYKSWYNNIRIVHNIDVINHNYNAGLRVRF